MYRVLLADGDRIVVDSLREILERDFPGQCEFHAALSQTDAARVSRETGIDVAFLGAGMDGADGVLAVKKIALPPARPIERNGIAASMRCALAVVDIARRKRFSESQIREKLDSVVTIVEGDFLYSLIYPPEKSGDIETYLDFFNIRDTAFYFMILEVADLESPLRPRAYQTIRDVIGSDCGSCGGRAAIVSPFMRNRLVVFVPASAAGETPGSEGIASDSVASETRAFVGDIHARITAALGIQVRIGVGPVEFDFSRSVFAYDEALKSLMAADGKNEIAFASDGCEASGFKYAYPEAAEGTLLDCLSSGDLPGAHAQLSLIAGWIRSRYPDDSDILKGKLFEILTLARHRTHAARSRLGGFSVWKDTWNTLCDIEDPAEAERFVLACIDECADSMGERRPGRMSPIVVKSCAIIHESLSSDISLEDIARRVEISPFYFSKLFKEETGENFIDYLTMARVRRAKELLLDRALSVRDVGVESGYSDPNYFSKLFKKVVGLTPTEYRESV
jgi:two-component system response regulator YesN